MKHLLIGLLVTVMVAVGIAGVWWTIQSNQYSHYDTANSGPQLSMQIKHPNKPGHLTILFVYKHGCIECDSVESQVIDHIRSASQSATINFVMADANRPSVRQMVNQLSIHNDPTVAVYWGGKLVQQYSGTNVRAINESLAGHSLRNAKAIPLTAPSEGFVVNDVTHTRTIRPYSAAAKLGVQL